MARKSEKQIGIIRTEGLDDAFEAILRAGGGIDAAAQRAVAAGAERLAEGIRQRTPRSTRNRQHIQDYARWLRSGRDGNVYWAQAGYAIALMDNPNMRAKQAAVLEYGTPKRAAVMAIRRTTAEDARAIRQAMLDAIAEVIA